MLRSFSKRLSRTLNVNGKGVKDSSSDSSSPSKETPKHVAQEIESLTKLAEAVTASVATITKYLQKNGIAEPSLSAENQTSLPRVPELVAARENLLMATSRLEALTQFQNFDQISPVMYGWVDYPALYAVDYFDVANKLEHNVEYHISEIGERTGCKDHIKLAASLRLLTQYHIFRETRENYFIHTRFSLELRDERIRGLVKITEECAETAPSLYKAMEQHPTETSDKYSPWAVWKGVAGQKSYYEYAVTKPQLMANFGKAMQVWNKSSFPLIASNYPWKELGSATVVDVGGGKGHVSQFLARTAPDLKFVVQDGAYEAAQQELPGDLADRITITFEKYDYWKPQPRKADVYFLRHIIHNHSDESATNLIKGFVPQLTVSKDKSGGRLLICEKILTPIDSAPPLMQEAMKMNMTMVLVHNARERTFSEFEALFKAADPRFRCKQYGSNGPLGSEILEAWLEEPELAAVTEN